MILLCHFLEVLTVVISGNVFCDLNIYVVSHMIPEKVLPYQRKYKYSLEWNGYYCIHLSVHFSGCFFLNHQSGRSWYYRHQLKWTIELPASVIGSSSILGSSVRSACPVSLPCQRGRQEPQVFVLSSCATCSSIQSTFIAYPNIR